MRKLRLLFATFALLVTGVVAVNAEEGLTKPEAPTFSWTTEGVAPEVGQKYFIYNVGSGTFLGAGQDWGTRAIVTDENFVLPDGNQSLTANQYYALAFELESAGMDVYFIKHYATNKAASGDNYLVHEGANQAWVDGGTGRRDADNNGKWIIESKTNGYLITPYGFGENISFGVHGTNLISSTKALTWTDLNYSSLEKAWVYWRFIPVATLSADLEKYPVYLAKVNLYEELCDAIDAYNNSADNLAKTAKADFATSIQSALDTYNSTSATAEAINGAVTTLSGAYDTYVTSGARPNDGYPFDFSSKITNPTINGADGWTISRPVGGNGPLLNGVAFEYWAGNASNRDEASFDYYQEISGLPAGKYSVTAEMYNSLNGEGGATFSVATGVYASVGENEVSKKVESDGTTLTEYTTDEIEVKAGETLRIGVKSFARMGARWFSADNFKLNLVELTTLNVGSSVSLPDGMKMDDKYFPSFYAGTDVVDGKLISLSGTEVKFSTADEEGLVATPKVVKIGESGDEGDEVTLSQGLTENQWSFTMPDVPVKVKAIYVAAARYNILGVPVEHTTTTVDGIEQSEEGIKALPGKKVVVTPDQRYELTDFSVKKVILRSRSFTPALTMSPDPEPEVEVTVTDEANGAKSFIMPEFDVEVAFTPALIVKELADDMITLTDGEDFEYTGEPQEPGIKVYDPEYDYELVEGTDYTVEYSDNVEAGKGTITITGIGDYYSGEAKAVFFIGRKDLNEDDITVAYIYQEDYDGAAHTPFIEVRDGVKPLVLGVDYKVTFKDNVEAGSVRVTIDGLGDYKGRIRKYFNIKSFVLDVDMIQDIPEQAWTGSAVTPAIVVINGNVTLTQDKDFTVKFKNNVNEGTATAIINGTGNFRSIDLVKTFKIVKKAEVTEPEAVDSPGEATAIDGVKAAKAGKTAYDLQGRKVVGNRKAVVIIDGKLVLKK